MVSSVSIGRGRLTFNLADGRSVAAPIEWFPRLTFGTVRERRNWRLIGAGYGVHWPDLDEHISVENMILGQRSMESARSLRAWVDQRPRQQRSRD
jgi:hypothetical protein